jgi:hypothetical protein
VLDLGRHAVVEAVEQHPRALGILRVGAPGRADEVREEDSATRPISVDSTLRAVPDLLKERLVEPTRPEQAVLALMRFRRRLAVS